jgi:dihydrofolate reductase
LKDVKIIAAIGPDGIMGIGGSLPAWELYTDLKRFSGLTKGGTVIQGGNTWSSLKMPNGLPKRLNLVVTRNAKTRLEGCTSKQVQACASLKEAVEVANTREDAGDSVWIIGGADLYREALQDPSAFGVTELHLTFVMPQPFNRDWATSNPANPVFFPDWGSWGPEFNLHSVTADLNPKTFALEAYYMVFRRSLPSFVKLSRTRELMNAAERLGEAFTGLGLEMQYDSWVREQPGCFWRGAWLMWARTFSGEAQEYLQRYAVWGSSFPAPSDPA